MASTALSPDSLVYCEGGWLFASSLHGKAKILGINRHGRPTFESVRVDEAQFSSRVGFLGTAAAFGAFSCDSGIVDADGAVRPLAQVVETGTISDLTFENYAPVPKRVAPELLVPILWGELVSVSAFHTATSLSVRCRERSATIGRTWQSLALRVSNQQKYCIVDRVSLTSDIELDWSGYIDDLVTALTYVVSESRYEIERDMLGTMTWFRTARKARRKTYLLEYDSLQHSAYVGVVSPTSIEPPVGRGKTAFLAPTGFRNTARLFWDDSAWHPLASGFLLGNI